MPLSLFTERAPPPPKSLASHRKFLSGCLLITFSVYIRLPFIQGNSASPIHREPLRSSHLWGGWGPAGKRSLRGSACGESGNGHTLQNCRAEAQGKTSQTSVFPCEGGQRLKLTPAHLGNKSIEILCADQTLMLVVNFSIQTELELQGKTLLSGETWCRQVQGKKQNKSLRAFRSRDRHKGRMLASLLQAGSLERI